MESRKYQLKKQIIEALESNDGDLYSLLRSQWAHRFGVESLEELKNLDLVQPNPRLTDLNNEKLNKTKEIPPAEDKAFKQGEDYFEKKEIRINDFQSRQGDDDESSKAKSFEIVDNENGNKKEENLSKVGKINPKYAALIPLPPKPRYSYLKKWLLSV